MPSIIFDNPLKKKFEMIRGKFLSTGLFESITRAETLELMIDTLNFVDYNNTTVFSAKKIKLILEKRKEKK